jgi:curli biogenesis system outer membrane secretion channel CsgG
MAQMQQQYETQNSGFSPNYSATKIYTLAILPPTSSAKLGNDADLSALYDHAGMTMLQTGHFTPVERSRIEAVLKEQEFGSSGIVDPSSAAKLGKVVGADAVMMTNVATMKHDAFFADQPDQRECELYVKVVSSSTAEILYYGRGDQSSFNGELDALQGAFQNATSAIKHKGSN